MNEDCIRSGCEKQKLQVWMEPEVTCEAVQVTWPPWEGMGGMEAGAQSVQEKQLFILYKIHS